MTTPTIARPIDLRTPEARAKDLLDAAWSYLRECELQGVGPFADLDRRVCEGEPVNG